MSLLTGALLLFDKRLKVFLSPTVFICFFFLGRLLDLINISSAVTGQTPVKN